MKKIGILCLATLLLVVILVVAGCAPKPAPAPTPAPAPAPAAKAIKWTFQAAFPAGDPWYEDAVEIIQKRILPATGGRMTIDVFPAGAIVPDTQEADALRTGSLDYAYTAGGYNKHLNPAFPLFDQMAGGLSTTQLYYWLQAYGGNELAEAEYLKYDLIYLCSQLGPPEDFAYTKGIELKTLADVKKLKMRTAGVGGEIMQKLGASTVFLPGGELYESMQRGVINSFEYSGAASFWDMKFQEVVSNVYISTSRAPSDSNVMLVSKKAWTALPDDLKAIVLWIQRGAQQITWERTIPRNGVALQKMKDYGLKVDRLPKEIEDAVISTSQTYFDSEVTKYGADSLYAKVVKSMREYKKLADAQGVF